MLCRFPASGGVQVNKDPVRIAIRHFYIDESDNLLIEAVNALDKRKILWQYLLFQKSETIF